MILLDTHVVGWLYEGEDRRLSATARQLLASQPARVSPIVELELTYLFEVGKVSKPAVVPLGALARSIGLGVDDVATSELVDAALGLTWTRDPFDRLIAAHAIVADAPLLTADGTILEHLPQAVWE